MQANSTDFIPRVFSLQPIIISTSLGSSPSTHLLNARNGTELSDRRAILTVSEQDKANPVFRLATRAGKMGLARSGLPALFPEKRNYLV